ncbi:hypothetical protein Goshw_003771 [Gossypium schwendimanii]|uniref:Uncharacterized protein n=1 Tax=Gossypium schwendimanii TaxID=34291 RepID=A0A7J9MZ97_GOSSC|nr:hypothetical protein [Gossypium schwendimanii]
MGPMTTPEYSERWAKRINDNILGTSLENSQSIEEHLQVVPSELEITKQDFERRNAELEKKIEQVEEEKMNLRLDVDVQKLEADKLRKGKNKWRDEIREERNRSDRWERKFQEVQARNEALESSLSESQKEKEELKDRIVELEGSLRQHRSRNSVIELKASLSKIEEMKGKIEELKAVLRSCEIREVADHLQTLAVQADTLSVKYELESDRGQELASLLKKIKALTATGHSIEHCTAFKKLVERLIKMGVVKVDDSSGMENPLPNYTDAGVNMTGEGMGRRVNESIAENMMDNGEIEFFEEVGGKESIYASESETRISKVNHPVIIISRPRVTETLEFINATFIAEGNRIPVLKISRTTRMGLQLMVGKGAVPGKGLRRYLQGEVEVPVMKEKFDHFGLGYRPDVKQRRKEIERRQERRRARLSGNEVRMLEVKSVEELLGDLYINALDTVERETLLKIRPYEPGSDLNNWTAEEIPVVFRACSE